ncbi:MAG: 2OG-Fe(II) oxygenase family protein [Alphaproteobacteria bacterium]
MFESSQMLPLFAVPVWAQVLEADVAGPLNAHLLGQLDSLKPETANDTDGWQTRNDLHTLDPFGQMVEVIGESSKRVLEMLKVAPAPFEITGCWMNIKPRGIGHPLHSHQNNYLSGVYYVKAPEGADQISFHDTRMERRVIIPRFTEETPLTARTMHIPVKTGILIMFPSWLQHSVVANPTEEMRVSLSFNIMFSNFTTTQAKPNWNWADVEMGGAV